MPLVRLSGMQRDNIRDVVLQAFATRDRLIELFQAVSQNFEQLEVPTSSLRDNVRAALAVAEEEGWLLALLAKSHELRREDMAIAALLADLEPMAPPPGTDHYAVCRLAGSHVMVDRIRLRESLQELDRPQGKRILVVTGAEGAGKTHSMQLISYVAMTKCSFTFVPIDLEVRKRMLGTDTMLDPDHLADRLVALLDYDDLVVPERPTDEQWATWVLKFCDKFEGHAREDERQVWVAIDAFNKVVLTQATLDLVKELANRIGLSLTHFRLILLGYGEPFAPALHAQVESEAIAPIGPKEVSEFFIAAFKQHGIRRNGARLAKVTHQVLTGLDPRDRDYLLTLGARASDELAKAKARKRTR
jgi:hypothetical protein